MIKANVISGEASETDSEEETHIYPARPQNVKLNSVQGAVVIGEDTESDNENDGASISSAVSALNQMETNRTEECMNKYDSLFQQKLRENNAQLQKDLDVFTNQLIEDAHKTVNNIDQHVLKSQITLQNAVGSLRAISVNSLNIKSKLHSILSSHFLQNVITKK